jgi:hypothetical protein
MVPMNTVQWRWKYKVVVIYNKESERRINATETIFRLDSKYDLSL